MSTVSLWKHGGVEYPLTASTEQSLLQSADPALYYALDLFVTVLNIYVKPRLLAQAALEDLRFPSAVEKTLHFEPTPFLLSDQLVFPLFCLYRSETQWTEQNKTSTRSDSVWEWAWVLPPLTPRQIEQLHPILRSVDVVMSTFAIQSFDPEYAAGATLRDLSGIQRMTAGPVRYGEFERISEQEKWWKAITGKLLVQEISAIVPEAFKVFTGADIAVDHDDGDGNTLERVVEVSTYGPPIVDSIAPTAGTKAGGTPVEILGSGFRPAAGTYRVLIGGAYASNVVVVHPTKIVCTSPEHEAFPTFVGDVRVLDPDDQESNVLEDAYTFTTP